MGEIRSHPKFGLLKKKNKKLTQETIGKSRFLSVGLAMHFSDLCVSYITARRDVAGLQTATSRLDVI